MIKISKQDLLVKLSVVSGVKHQEIKIIDGPATNFMRSAYLDAASHVLDSPENQQPLRDLRFTVRGLTSSNAKRKIIIRAVWPFEREDWQKGVFSLSGTTRLGKNEIEVIGIYDSKARKGIFFLISAIAEFSPIAVETVQK